MNETMKRRSLALALSAALVIPASMAVADDTGGATTYTESETRTTTGSDTAVATTYGGAEGAGGGTLATTVPCASTDPCTYK